MMIFLINNKVISIFLAEYINVKVSLKKVIYIIKIKIKILKLIL